MAIFVDDTTKVIYQGLTGSQGKFYGLLNKEYGTQVVAGTNPKKAGTDVDGIPVYASVGEAVEATGATTSCIFIPAPGVKDAISVIFRIPRLSIWSAVIAVTANGTSVKDSVTLRAVTVTSSMVAWA